MIADPLTQGKTRRNVLNDVVHKGELIIAHEVKQCNLAELSLHPALPASSTHPRNTQNHSV
eukprot:10277203-Prorocentrum_lima.AAC.1